MTPAERPDLPHQGLRGWGFRLLVLASVLSFSGYVLLLPVVPLWAARGGAGELGAGATTAVFMGTTVLTQLAMPWLLDHGGYRWTFAVGALLLGAPAPLLAAATDLGPLLAVSALRGVGFGMVTVVGSALAARLVPPEQIGRAAGYYGMAVGLPHVLLLSGGVWAALNLGFEAVFWAAGAAPVAGALAAAGIWLLAGSGAAGAAGPPAGPAAAPAGRGGRTYARLAAPLLLMLVCALSSSAVVTFLAIPLEEAAAVVFAALLAYGLLSVAGRWAAGALSDRRRRIVVLVPATVAAAVGMGLAAAALWPVEPGWTGPGALGAAAAVAGAALFGAGFGAVQNDTLVVMFRRAGPRGYGTASAVWNIGYDGGAGLGAVVVGLAVQAAGYGPAFALTATAVALCLPVAAVLVRRPH
ncbi:MFS transporter [Streptomonospora nanhaiensis]|uniref:MFS transporter n=1 Tax=Streptomonospora nanhaiensis TaxID=1323731 RepID=UPI0036207202